MSDTAARRASVADLGRKEVVTVGTSVIARASDSVGGWYAGTVVAVVGERLRVTFVDGNVEDIERRSVRRWARPPETAWHRKRKVVRGTKRRRGEQADPLLAAQERSATRAVEQLDAANDAVVARHTNARRASETVTWLPDAADIVACCRGHVPEAGGYKWRFSMDFRPKIETSDVDDLLTSNAKISIQLNNPKRPETKSHDLYENYKTAKTVREMLALGGRRGDVSYDIAHGWISFDDAVVAKRFSARVTPPTEPPEIVVKATTSKKAAAR